MAKTIPLEDFQKTFSSLIELSSASLGGHIVSFSDEFFAEASNLLKPSEPVSLKGQFGPNGALFDGWETRRHNPSFDWVIIRLGAPSGTVSGFDVDTRWFNGNEAPAVSVQGCFLPEVNEPKEDDQSWEEILPSTPCGPASRHLFAIPTTKPLTHIKLNMYPDGGIGRFRVYGSVIPIFPTNPLAAIDLVHVLNGGKCVSWSDQHFGVGSNLVLPGRGKDMGDGWETKRSRATGHLDWVILKLGHAGFLEWVEIDTAHFVGNFPESCEVHGLFSEQVRVPASPDDKVPETGPTFRLDAGIPPQDVPEADDKDWAVLLPRSKLGPHRQHYLQLNKELNPLSHIKVTIYPDGGIKRVRVIGRLARPEIDASLVFSHPIRNPDPSKRDLPPVPNTDTDGTDGPPGYGQNPDAVAGIPQGGAIPRIPALPLTTEAFKPYGSVIQSYPEPNSSPRSIKIKRVNFGTALKYNHLAPIEFLDPAIRGEDKAAVKGEPNFCVYRCEPAQFGADLGVDWEVKVLERHEFSTQAFVPMGNGGSRYLVVVALPGDDGKPDISTLRAFIATSSQGISYSANVWHHPMIALERVTDFACIVNETNVGSIDCEILEFEQPLALVEEPVVS